MGREAPARGERGPTGIDSGLQLPAVVIIICFTCPSYAPADIVNDDVFADEFRKEATVLTDTALVASAVVFVAVTDSVE